MKVNINPTTAFRNLAIRFAPGNGFIISQGDQKGCAMESLGDAVGSWNRDCERRLKQIPIYSDSPIKCDSVDITSIEGYRKALADHRQSLPRVGGLEKPEPLTFNIIGANPDNQPEIRLEVKKAFGKAAKVNFLEEVPNVDPLKQEEAPTPSIDEPLLIEISGGPGVGKSITGKLLADLARLGVEDLSPDELVAKIKPLHLALVATKLSRSEIREVEEPEECQCIGCTLARSLMIDEREEALPMPEGMLADIIKGFNDAKQKADALKDVKGFEPPLTLGQIIAKGLKAGKTPEEVVKLAKEYLNR